MIEKNAKGSELLPSPCSCFNCFSANLFKQLKKRMCIGDLQEMIYKFVA